MCLVCVCRLQGSGLRFKTYTCKRRCHSWLGCQSPRCSYMRDNKGSNSVCMLCMLLLIMFPSGPKFRF